MPRLSAYHDIYNISVSLLRKKIIMHVGNLSRHTMGTVGAQYGQVSSSSWGIVEVQLGQKAQYGKVQLCLNCAPTGTGNVPILCPNCALTPLVCLLS